MSTQKFLISLALAVGASRLSGAVTSYPDRATMEAAVPLLTFANISFGGVITGDGTFSGGLTDATTNVQFFGTCQCGGVANITISTVAGWSASPALQEVNGAHEMIHVVFPANIFAFGADLIFIAGSPAPYEIDFTDTTGHSITTSGVNTLPGSTFFGVRSDQAIVSADIYNLNFNNTVGFDNFEIGTQGPAETPEIATFMMIGLGLLSLRYLKRWMPPGV